MPAKVTATITNTVRRRQRVRLTDRYRIPSQSDRPHHRYPRNLRRASRVGKAPITAPWIMATEKHDGAGQCCCPSLSALLIPAWCSPCAIFDVHRHHDLPIYALEHFQLPIRSGWMNAACCTRQASESSIAKSNAGRPAPSKRADIRSPPLAPRGGSTCFRAVHNHWGGQRAEDVLCGKA